MSDQPTLRDWFAVSVAQLEPWPEFDEIQSSILTPPERPRYPV